MDRFPRWSRLALAEFVGVHHECHLWDTGRDARVNNPVTSDVPSLVFQGEWDPAVPNPPIQAAASHLRNGTFVQVPGIGHGALGSYLGWQDCPRSVAAAFLRNPTAPLDASCVAAMPHVHFETSLPSFGGSRSDDVRALLRDTRERCGSDASCRLYDRLRRAGA